MTVSADDTSAVLPHFLGNSAAAARSLGNAGGFSGAALWQVVDGDGTWCLRRWPREHPTPDRLQYIHGVLRHVADHGFTCLPLPRPAGSESFVSHAGHLWELAEWLPGSPVIGVPSDHELVAAMSALAQFHVAAASFPRTGPSTGTPRGLTERSDRLRQFTDQRLQQLQLELLRVDWPEFTSLGERVLGSATQHCSAVSELIKSSLDCAVPLQPCIRDIWKDHVLFDAGRVKGLIDFGAMRTESVAGDVARLLGSLVADDRERRQIGLEAYQEIRPMNDVELRLVDVFDRSTVLLSGLNWLDWIVLQRRSFDDRTRVVERLREIVSRLEQAPAKPLWRP